MCIRDRLWVDYLAVYDDVLQNGSSADALEGVAVTPVIAELEALGLQNQQDVIDVEFDAIVEVSSSMNLVSLDEGAVPLLSDCTTHQVRSPLGDPFEIFATQEVTFEANPNGGWLISDVNVVQDGWFGEAWGCVPEAHATEAARVAELFQQFGLALESDPSQPLPEAMLEISSDDIADAMLQARSSLISLNMYSDSEADVFQELLGLNFQFASVEGPVVRIDSCVSYPEGQDLRSIDTDEVIQQGLPPGGAQGTSIDVLVREGFEGEVIAISPVAEGTC